MFVFSIAIVIIIITSREFINLPTGFRDAGNLGLIVFFFFFLLYLVRVLVIVLCYRLHGSLLPRHHSQPHYASSTYQLANRFSLI